MIPAVPMVALDPRPQRAIVLSAGGLASTVVLHWLIEAGTHVAVLSCDIGSPSPGLRYAAATTQQLGCDHRVVDLSPVLTAIGAHPNPNRATALIQVSNGLAIALDLAVAWAIHRGADAVLVGIHAEDTLIRPECNTRFLAAFTRQAVLGNLTLSAQRFTIRAPLAELTVAEIVRLGNNLTIAWERTWSCHRSGPTHCGRCSGCRRRRGAFTATTITDPTHYHDYDDGPATP